MKRLKLHLVERADFHKYFDPSAGEGGLFIPSSDPPMVGEPITVEVMFQGGPRVLVHGVIAWRRQSGDARTRPGAGIAINPREQSKLNYLQGYVRGGLLDMREKRRLPVRLRVAYSSPTGRRINFTRDLNEEGAFLRTGELLVVGAATTILISPPGGVYAPIEVRGIVTRQDSSTDRGVGVRFEFGSDEQRNRYVSFFKKLEQEYLAGSLPDAALL